MAFKKLSLTEQYWMLKATLKDKRLFKNSLKTDLVFLDIYSWQYCWCSYVGEQLGQSYFTDWLLWQLYTTWRVSFCQLLLDSTTWQEQRTKVSFLILANLTKKLPHLHWMEKSSVAFSLIKRPFFLKKTRMLMKYNDICNLLSFSCLYGAWRKQ